MPVSSFVSTLHQLVLKMAKDVGKKMKIWSYITQTWLAMWISLLAPGKALVQGVGLIGKMCPRNAAECRNNYEALRETVKLYQP